MGGVRKKNSPGNSRVKSMVESIRVLERERRRLALCTSFTVAVWRIKPEKYSRSKEAEISVCLFLVRAESGQSLERCRREKRRALSTRVEIFAKSSLV